MKFPSKSLVVDIVQSRQMRRKEAIPFLYNSATAEGYSPIESRELTVWALEIPKSERARHFPRLTKRKYTKAADITVPMINDAPVNSTVQADAVLSTLEYIKRHGWKPNRITDAEKLIAGLTVDQKKYVVASAHKSLERHEQACKSLRWALKRLCAANEIENKSPISRVYGHPKTSPDSEPTEDYVSAFGMTASE